MGTLPATAPRKKYDVGIGYVSMKWSSGLAKAMMPRPPPAEKAHRKMKEALSSRVRALTA